MHFGKQIQGVMRVGSFCAMAAFADATPYLETWEDTLAGWVDRDAGKMTATFDATVGNPAGSLGGRFEAQGVPVPETDAFQATGASSGGAFTGNYWTAQMAFSGWTFDFYAADVMPSDILVRFGGAGSAFFANAKAQVGGTAAWYTVRTPATFGGGWRGGTEAQWSNALSSVEYVEVQITRSGAEAQTYYLDNFSSIGVLQAPAAPVAGEATNRTTTGFHANWSASETATNYLLDVSMEASFANCVDGYQDLGVGNVLTWPVAGLSAGQTYFYRVRAQNGGGTSGNSETISTMAAKADQTIGFPAIDDHLTTDAVELSATASSGLAVSFSVVSGPAGIDGATVTFTGAGVVSISATQAGDGTWNAATPVTNTFAVTKASARVTLHGLAQTYDGSMREVTATTDPEGLSVAMTYEGGATAPTVVGDYAVSGTIVSEMYQGSASGTLVIGKADQTIDFAAIGEKWTTDEVELSATASSGLAVSFAVASGPGSLVGATLTFTGAGEVSLVASQAGDDVWNAAPEVTQTVAVAVQPPGLELSSAGVNVREAGEGRFYVRLDRAPQGDVAAGVSRVAGDAGLTVKGGEALIFTPANWSAWQAVTLAAEEDGNGSNETALFRISMEGSADQSVEATALDDDIGENLALASGGSLISGTQATKPEWLIDGIHLSRENYGYTVWTNQAEPGTITLDLRVATTVSRIRLLNWDWGYRTHQYRIESSLNGATWSSLVEASSGEHRGWEDWAVANRTARYLRFTGLSNSANRYVCLAEWEVYGARNLAGVPQVEVSRTNVNVREAGEGRFYVRLDRAPAAHVPVSVLRGDGEESVTVQSGAALKFGPSDWAAWQMVTLSAPEDIDDVGETDTFWVSAPGALDKVVVATTLDDDIGPNLALASGGATIAGSRNTSIKPEWLIDGVHTSSASYGYTTWTNEPPGTMTLDLKAAAAVSRIRLLNWDWGCRTHQYRIESSLDGAEWSVLVDASASEQRGWEDWAVAGESIRYLRFTGVSNSANSYVCLAEWEVYGVSEPLSSIDVSSENVNVREAGEGRFFVRLASAPQGNVTIAASRGAGDPNLSVKSGAARTFTPANWSAWQAVTLAAGADGNADGETATIRLSGPGVGTREVTATTLDDDIGENWALASAGSSISGTLATKPEWLIDGVHLANANYGYTVWTNRSSPGTMTLDLKAATTVSRIRLLNWDWGCRTHQYRIEGSLDGAEWSVLVDASSGEHRGWEDWAVADPSIRYLRFTGLANSANSYVCIAEWEVYGERTPGRRSLAPAPVASAVAESEPVTVVTSDDVAPDYEGGWAAVDGDPDTAWTGQKAGGGYLVVGYEPTLRLTALEVDLGEGSLTNLECLYSLDAQQWSALPEGMETNPIPLNFLWLLFADDGTEAVPEVIEIRPNP